MFTTLTMVTNSIGKFRRIRKYIGMYDEIYDPYLITGRKKNQLPEHAPFPMALLRGVAKLILTLACYKKQIAGNNSRQFVFYHQPRHDGPVAAAIAPITAPAPPNRPPNEAETPML